MAAAHGGGARTERPPDGRLVKAVLRKRVWRGTDVFVSAFVFVFSTDAREEDEDDTLGVAPVEDVDTWRNELDRRSIGVGSSVGYKPVFVSTATSAAAASCAPAANTCAWVAAAEAASVASSHRSTQRRPCFQASTAPRAASHHSHQNLSAADSVDESTWAKLVLVCWPWL